MSSSSQSATSIEGVRLGIPGGSRDVPSRIGRYVIRDRVGAGGMGAVFEAHDAELDRSVAIKLIEHATGLTGQARVELEARCRREARALAALTHPNVVAVYEVGSLGDRTYIAMELVRGIGLDEWMQQPHERREVLDVFRQAGEGLAAAHEAGVIHRDFKPTNVIVGKDGRVRVLDFGLAIRGGEVFDAPLGSNSIDENPRLTETGAVMGTPAYMAPEQAAGIEVDARADQFAFCVSLFEALLGRRPFSGRSFAELQQGKQRGELDDVSLARLPRWLRTALLRGLAPFPERRWPSMRPLLDALQPPRAPFGIAGIGLAAVAVAVAVALPSHRVVDPCSSERASLEELWSPQVHRQLQSQLTSTERAVAESTGRRLSGRIDAWVERWSTVHDRVCSAPPAVADRGRACLRDQRRDLSASIDVLLASPEHVLVHGDAVVAALPEPSMCERTDGAPLPPPEIAVAVERVEEMRSRARALLRAGRSQEAVATSRAALAEAEELGYDPLHARARLGLALSLASLLHIDEATTLCEAAYGQAIGASDDATALDAAAQMVRMYGQRGFIDDALRWSRHADALLGRYGEGEVAEGRLRLAVGLALRVAGRLDEARDQLEAAVAIAQMQDDDALMASTLHGLGNVSMAGGEPDEALQTWERALRLRIEEVGPNHPRVANLHNNMGIVFAQVGRIEEARRAHERALAIRRAVHGSGHPQIAKSLGNLARVLSDAGELERADELFTELLDQAESRFGSDSLEVGRILHDYGNVFMQLDRFERAEKLYRRSWEIRRAKLPADNPERYDIRNNLSLSLQALGRLDEAVEHQRAVLAFRERWKPDHSKTLDSLSSMASMLIETGDPANAVPLIDRGLRRAGDDPERRADFEALRAKIR